jgi:AraC family transcriptional regulator of arabinose operon
MSAPSKWPLPDTGIRFLTPAFMVEKLARHPLTRECYPTAMGYYPEAKGHRMQRHRHDENLLLYCVSGRGMLRTEDWRGKVTAGQVIILPQGLAHEYEAHPKDPWTLYWVHFQGANANIFSQFLGYREGLPVLNAGLSTALAAGFSSLMEVRYTGYSDRAFINAANHLRYLFTQMALEVRATQARVQHNFNLEQLQAYMREHLNQSITLDTLAAMANMSKYHFSGKYKKLTGYSPIKHFLNMKMEHACHLLDSSNLSVKAIAAELGYEDQLYFSRLFSRTIGQSPRTYRASIRN